MSIGIVEAIVLLLLGGAVALSMLRLWLGPHSPDRIVAADTLAVISTAVILYLARIFDSPLYLDVALLYGALAFIGVVALARAIEENKR